MKNLKIEFKWAIIFTIATLAWMLLEKTLGWHDEKIADHYWLTLLFLPVVILLYVLALREKRRRFYDKKITWKQAFLSGLMVSVFAASLSPIAQYLTHNYITPEFFVKVKEYSVTNKLMTANAANDYFNINHYILQAALSALIGGAIISAIVAVFIRRKSVN
jgi:glucan phosphoethanolaminetransferase (alkaline phosphatase superfamily)